MNGARPAMRHRGINYDTGTVYVKGEDSRPDWSSATLHRHLATIADELYANAVNVFGSHPERLVEAARVGLERGLDVWVQPRLPDADSTATLALLAEVADAIEPLRDLDVASFGIVAVQRTESPEWCRYIETPKAAFHEIARRYRDADRH